MEDTSHFIDEEYDGQRARETPPDLVSTIIIMKVDNDRLMRALFEQEDMNAMLLQSLSKIHKQL
jgi:hypothetical protein